MTSCKLSCPTTEVMYKSHCPLSLPDLSFHNSSGCAGVINYETEIILRVKGDSFDAISLGLDLTLRCGLLTDTTSSMPSRPAS